METMLLEVVNIVPELALAVVIVYFVLKRDDMWRSYFREVTEKSDASSERVATQYKELAERLEGVMSSAVVVMSRLCDITEMRQGLTEDLIKEFRAVLAESR